MLSVISVLALLTLATPVYWSWPQRPQRHREFGHFLHKATSLHTYSWSITINKNADQIATFVPYLGFYNLDPILWLSHGDLIPKFAWNIPNALSPSNPRAFPALLPSVFQSHKHLTSLLTERGAKFKMPICNLPQFLLIAPKCLKSPMKQRRFAEGAEKKMNSNWNGMSEKASWRRCCLIWAWESWASRRRVGDGRFGVCSGSGALLMRSVAWGGNSRWSYSAEYLGCQSKEFGSYSLCKGDTLKLVERGVSRSPVCWEWVQNPSLKASPHSFYP